MTNGFMGIMRAMASFIANMPRSISSTMTTVVINITTTTAITRNLLARGV